MNLNNSTHRAYGGTGDAPSVTCGTDNLWAALVRRESTAGPGPVGWGDPWGPPNPSTIIFTQPSQGREHAPALAVFAV